LTVERVQMNRLVRLSALSLLCTAPIAAAGGPRLGADLRTGMQLVYSWDGHDQPPWSLDAVETGGVFKDGAADCIRLVIRRQPDQVEPEENRLCIVGNNLYGWDPAREGWVKQRPVGPDMELTLGRSNGDTVQYATGAVTEEVVGTFRLSVVATTVTTLDSSGRPRRRLRERYAVSLAAATGGRFEVPDPFTPGAWRTQQVFELRYIR
jgi:hypothetical protein